MPTEYYVTSAPVITLWCGIYRTAMTYDMRSRRLSVHTPALPTQAVTVVGAAGHLWR